MIRQLFKDIKKEMIIIYVLFIFITAWAFSMTLLTYRLIKSNNSLSEAMIDQVEFDKKVSLFIISQQEFNKDLKSVTGILKTY